MTPERQIKQLALDKGADLVGIAAVEAVNQFAPPGHRPDDVLARAQSVIVFAGRTILRGAWRSPQHMTQHVNSDFAQQRAGISNALAKFIENEYGYYALAHIPPTVGLNASISLKLCAELAGLGKRSLAGGVLLHPELGFINLYACITTMALQPDDPMDGAVCPHPSCVKLWKLKGTTPCLSACPDCLSGEIGDHGIKWMQYDRRICSTRAQTFSEGALLRTLLEAADEPDPHVRKRILLGSFSRRAIQAIAYSTVIAQCIECLRQCPICIDANRLR